MADLHGEFKGFFYCKMILVMKSEFETWIYLNLNIQNGLIVLGVSKLENRTWQMFC